MKCPNCEANVVIQTGRPYRYTQCGLDNVYLVNIEVHKCPACESEYPVIPCVLDLYETLARAIVRKQSPLNGAEARFLRKQLGLTAKAWAAYLRVDVSTLSRWENGDTSIGSQSDGLMRLLYTRILEEKEGRLVSEPLAEQIASARTVREDDVNVVVNMHNPDLYQYRSRKEIACAHA